jgi:hypothetical protein
VENTATVEVQGPDFTNIFLKSLNKDYVTICLTDEGNKVDEKEVV